MIVKSLLLKNFKNLSGNFTFGDTNLIAGRNGIGKTNLLESLYYLGRGESFRHSNERNLLAWHTKYNFAKLEAVIQDEKEEVEKIEAVISDDGGILRKKLSVNQVKRSKIDFSHTLPVILFQPQDVEIVSGSPDIRRAEIDNFLGMVDPAYKKLINDYKKVLQNRNKLLKNIRADEAGRRELDYWTEQTIELGSEIIIERVALLNDFRPVIKAEAKNLFAEELKGLDFEYETKFAQKGEEVNKSLIYERLSGKLYSNLDREIRAGVTLYGPQREDVKFYADHIDIHEFGSRGQQRLVSLVLKLAMWQFYYINFDRKPLLLLDDIMSELDEVHRKKVEEIVVKYDPQVFYTAAHKSDLSPKIRRKAEIIELG